MFTMLMFMVAILIAEEGAKMTAYEEGLKLIEEIFAGGKDNVISLATVTREPNSEGKPRPVVRSVNAYYEDNTFYVVTYGKSNKILQITQNSEVAIAGCFEMFTTIGIGENLGWVLDPKNSEIRTKLRTTFAKWYDEANNENDENCVILKITLTRGTLNVNHWEKLYHMDFVNKTTMQNGGVF
jgi:uncharacterized pyridoxamine 5'-phosphate oxidase family protein